MTTSEFVKAAALKHDGKYDYSKTEYVNANTKVLIICSAHGEFSQIPRKHLSGSGCRKCANSSTAVKQKMGHELFVSEASSVHSSRYSYPQFELERLTQKVPIECPVHGLFHQQAMSHLNGHGCKLCSSPGERAIRVEKFDTPWFVSRAIEVHGDRYDYSSVSYTKSHLKVSIVCKLHGLFDQDARDHLAGYGCPRCGIDYLSIANAMPWDEFVGRANSIHGGKYEYQNADRDGDGKLTIRCSEHGDFKQKSKHHLRGQGCPECKVSSGHSEICRLIESLGFVISVNDRSVITPMELDVYVPSVGLAIEFNGIYWHSYGAPETRAQMMRHADKHAACKSAGVSLFQIFENEWYDRRELVSSMIAHRLGVTSRRIGARKLSIRQVSIEDSRAFFDVNHLKGYVPASVTFGLSDDSGWVAMMSFSRSGEGYELMRYACSMGCSVSGGAGRLFGAFVRDRNPKFVKTYADARYSDGAVYERIGFSYAGRTRPNYHYVKGGEIYSRQKFMKHKLAAALPSFDPSMSESANMFANGYRRLWDCGHARYMWRPR